MFHYGVVLILSPKMVYIKSKTVEPERESPDKKIHHVRIAPALLPVKSGFTVTQEVKAPT